MEKSINNLIEENLDILKSYARNLSKNSYEADDLLNETVVKVIENYHLFKEGSNFVGWCVTVMRNLKKNELRYNSIHETEEINYDNERDLGVSFNEADVEICNKFIKTNLSEKLSSCFILYLSGFDYKEIGNKLNIPEGTVKSRLNKARTVLKSLLSSPK